MGSHYIHSCTVKPSCELHTRPLGVSVPEGLQPNDLDGHSRGYVRLYPRLSNGFDGPWISPLSHPSGTSRNPMPESVTDRQIPAATIEWCLCLTKQERYFYDSEAVRAFSHIALHRLQILWAGGA